MKTTILKSLLTLVLALLALPMLSQDFMVIYLKNGDIRKFYMKNITEIAPSKIDTEGVQHSDYSSQRITTIYDTYVYNLEDVDSITFTKIDEELAEHNFVTAMPEVFSAISECEIIDDVEEKIDQIKNTEGVADAWSDGHQLYVAISEDEVYSFHFSHNADMDTSFINNATAQIRLMKPQLKGIVKPDGTPIKAVIANQQHKDEHRDWHKDSLFYPLINAFRECGVDARYVDEPTVDFFYDNSDDPNHPHFYDYDIVILVTHGSYRPELYYRKPIVALGITWMEQAAFGLKCHSFLTSEDLPIDVKEKPEEDPQWIDYYKKFKKWRDDTRYKNISDAYINFSFCKEERSGKVKWIAHPELTEFFFRDIAEGKFLNPHSVFFNIACQSLMGDDGPSYTLADELLSRGLGSYIGYDQTNTEGQHASHDCFRNMLSGMSLQKAYNELTDEERNNHVDEIVAHLLIYPQNEMDLFLYPTITIKADNAYFNNQYLTKQSVTLVGFTTHLKNAEIETGFEFGETSDLTPELGIHESVIKQRVVNNELGNYHFELTVSDPTPGQTYYYRAYTYDGLHYNYGDTYSFTIKEEKKEPYAVLSDNNKTLTFYYDNQKETRNGLSVGPFTSYSDVSWGDHQADIATVVFDPSFADCTTITSTAYWFYNLSQLTEISGINNLNTSNVINMYAMFFSCSKLTSLDVSHFDTGNVTDMAGMFYSCTGLTSLDVSHFDTGYVTNMNKMFYGCSGLKSLDVSHFDTSNVISIGGIFSGCSGLTSLDVSHFDTGNVMNMYGMFSSCSGLTSLDLSGFNTANVRDMFEMFYNDPSLTTIYASNKWSTAKVSNGNRMFYDCTNLVGGNGTTYNANHIDHTYARIDKVGEPGYFTDKDAPVVLRPYAVLSDNNSVLTFYYDDQKEARGGLSVGPFSGFSYSYERWGGHQADITTVVFDSSFASCTLLTSTAQWFEGFTNLTTIIGIENLKTDNVTNMRYMFSECSSLTSLDVSHFDTSNVTDMFFMFSDCSSLTSLDLSHFDTSNVTNMAFMLGGCSNLTSLDLSHFDTSNVIDMEYMFHICSSLTSLDLSHFDTGNVKNMESMFDNCTSLTSLDLSHFDTGNVTNMYGMFWNCSNLVTIYADTRWSFDHLENGWGMFYSCYNLVGGNGTTYDENHVDYTYARIDKVGEPGYFTDKNTPNIVDLQLSATNLNMQVGESQTVTIASGNGNYLYGYDHDGIVSVSISGAIITIDALNAGEVGVTITDTKSGQQALISIRVFNPGDDIPAEAVDLGLPSGTKWASYNIGATKPEEYGDYYSWGETETKTEYLSSNYSYSSSQNIDIAGTGNDVAHVKWGGSWRMPTREQAQEMLDNCTSSWVRRNGVYGGKFTGPNGNSIFVPAAGFIIGSQNNTIGNAITYWTSTPDDMYDNCAYTFNIRSCVGLGCYEGLTVRPVISGE